MQAKMVKTKVVGAQATKKTNLPQPSKLQHPKPHWEEASTPGFASEAATLDIQTQHTTTPDITWGRMAKNVLGTGADGTLQGQQGLVVQRKMTLGEVGDRYEAEADRLAPQIVSQINRPGFGTQPPVFASGTTRSGNKSHSLALQLQALRPTLQLKGDRSQGTISPTIESTISRAKSGGHPLDSSLQQRLGQTMGTDFSGVRVHTDAQADGLNRSLSARAFTTGQNVFFRQGEYQPQSRSGQELIAHELTHVVQQNSGKAQQHNIQRDDIIQRDTIKQEDPSQMDPLYKRKYKKIGSRSIFLTTDHTGNSVKTNWMHRPATKNIDGTKRLQILRSVTNPPGGIPDGDYYFIKFMEVNIDQTRDDHLQLNWVYGYILESEVKALGSYQHIAKIGTDTQHPKQGKILPETDADPPISQQDVYQSAISDCYLHAALIAIVHANPWFIYNLFTRIDINDLDIRFPGYDEPGRHIDPLKVTLHKKLFLTPDGKPLYGGKKDSYLWPAFVQKAWAVHQGKYSKLAMGLPLEITSMITGQNASATLVGHDPNEKANKAWQLYTAITTALNEHKPVTIATDIWTDRKPKRLGGFERVMPSKADHGGLGIAHVYAVLRVSNQNQHRSEQDPNALPTNITFTLRDPRTESGDTFELSLENLLDQRKVNYVSIGG
jgi:hypothetical protein